MEHPSDPANFVCDLENMLHSGVLSPEQIQFYEEFIAGGKWTEVCKDYVGDFFWNLRLFLYFGAIVNGNEDFGQLLPRVLAGRRNIHQMCEQSDVVDHSGFQQNLSNFLSHTLENMGEDDEISDAFPTEAVVEFARSTPNKYLIINLLLCTLNEDYHSAYQDYVRGKVSRYKFTLAFWRPFYSLFEPDCPISHILWMDLLCDLVGPKMSEAQMRRAVLAAETNTG